MPDDFHVAARRANPVSLATIAREWGRIGVIGFGGPPAHIRLLRERCVERRGWMPGEDFEDALGACNLLPGPASTQLAVYCARVVAGTPGAIVGGLAFILPGLAAILALSAAVLSGGAPSWLRGAAAGAGAAVAVVALQAAIELGRASVRRPGRASATRWPLYALAGAAAAIFAGQAVVLALLGAGALELAARRRGHAAVLTPWLPVGTAGTPLARGSLLALGWVALKVGALSYGGGFVIIPLMQADAVHHYHWLTASRFLDAVALGQITPGPVVLTVAAVGYAAHGVGGALLGAAIAFTPSFVIVIAGAARFERLRGAAGARAFLAGAGPAAIGAIGGSVITLAGAVREPWQGVVLGGAAALVLLARRSVLSALLLGAVSGLAVALLGGPVPH